MSMDRRNFIKGSVALGGVAALGALAGCSPAGSANTANADTANWMPEKWDYEADLIVVGAGAAGNAAAIEGTERGLSVIVIEALDQLMGSSCLCNGGIAMPNTPLQKEQGIEDSADKMYDDLVRMTAPGNDPELIKVHCDNVVDLWDWLTGMGVEFKKESLIGTVGQSVPREHHVQPALVVQTLNERAKKDGAEFLMGTVAERLVQDPSTKRVIGVTATQGNTSLTFKAKRAVLLASGGYARNEEMLSKYFLGLGSTLAFCGAHDLGEGILMAQQIGADVHKMHYFSLLPVQNPSGEPTAAAGMMNVGAIMVNKEGNRFVDESLGYSQTWMASSLQTDGTIYQVWDQVIYDEYYSNDSSLYNMEKLEKSNTLMRADTLEELAEVMGVPADAFVAAVTKYNEDIATVGYDTVFGRKHLVSENGDAAPIDEGPFYGFEATNVIYVTHGGLREDTQSRVLDMYGDPIPGLYCAGNICNYAKYGFDIPTLTIKSPSGIGFGGAMVYGRLVAKYVSELDPWEE